MRRTRLCARFRTALIPGIERASKRIGDIPKTRNAKVMRRIIRAAYLDEKPGDTSALENPAAVEEIQRVTVRTQGD